MSKKNKILKGEKVLCKLLKILYKSKYKKGLNIIMSEVSSEMMSIQVSFNDKVLKDFFASKEEVKKIVEVLEKLNADIKTIKSNNEQEIKNLKEDLDEYKNKIPSLKQEIENRKKELEYKDKQITELENDKQKAQNDSLECRQNLDNVKKEFNFNLFEFYGQLPQDFRDRFTFIKYDTWINFVVTSGSKDTLINLYNNIKTSKANDIHIIEFFNTLFEMQSKVYNLVRLIDKDKFDESEHIDIISSKSRGEIEKTLLLGFKDGNKTYHSLVKVK
ncbi:MAG: hypothetical protein MSA33_07505 [Campylobacter sp.]|uniref:hypothetical protein n=1 Tax=Campylobacter sp. TaxID=205 RepID=UPI002AA8F3A3|nr:hypothetical protein [Campylobacter sp.]MCI7550271.1 hypothetical protein [Campylobacter sp.]